MSANIVVCGREHVGKTSLVEHVGEALQSQFRLIKAAPIAFGQEPADYVEDIRQVLARLSPGIAQQIDCYWLCVDAAKGLTEVDKALFSALNGRALLVATKADLLTQEGVDRLLAELRGIAPPDRGVLRSNISDKFSSLSKLDSQSRAIILADEAQPCGKKLVSELADEAAKEEEERRASAKDTDFAEYMRMRGSFLRNRASEEADSIIHWAAGRALAIAIIPLPLADVLPLVANEAYMIHQVGSCYGYSLDESVIVNFIGCLGASVGGKIVASFIPFLKAPIAAGITYAVGMTAKEYFASEMTIKPHILHDIYEEYSKAAKDFNWK